MESYCTPAARFCPSPPSLPLSGQCLPNLGALLHTELSGIGHTESHAPDACSPMSFPEATADITNRLRHSFSPGPDTASESFILWVVIQRTPINWLQLAQELKFICQLRIKVDPCLLEGAAFLKTLYFEIR